MTTRYARSTDGNNADTGLTWALAKANVANACSAAATGDSVYVSQVHSETTAASITVAIAGTLASPGKLLCGNDAAEPPTALSTGAIVAQTGSGNVVITGSAYIYGISFRSGAAGNSGSFPMMSGSEWQRYERCEFRCLGTLGGTIAGSSSAQGRLEFVDCDVLFSAAGSGIQARCDLHWNGGSVISGSTSPTVLITAWNAVANFSARLLVENVDFSNFGAGFNLSVAPHRSGVCIFRNCKLPASWTGSPLSGSFSGPGRIEMYNCASGPLNYKVWIEDYAGSIKDETLIVRAGGSSNGTTDISWKMASAANCQYPTQPLVSPEMLAWNDVVGTGITCVVELIHDSATALKDDEVWLEVQYLGSGSNPKGTAVSDSKADVLATGANQTSSGATWSDGSPSMSNPNKQKLSVSFTPQSKGYLIAKVMLAKSSKTIYVDPYLGVT